MSYPWSPLPASALSPMVYRLLMSGNVVYVGQTGVGVRRIVQHSDKPFDAIDYVSCLPSDLDLIEAALILVYAPKHNRTSPRPNAMLAASRLRAYGLEAEAEAIRNGRTLGGVASISDQSPWLASEHPTPAGKPPALGERATLVTVKQLVAMVPALTEGGVRWDLHNRSSNGLAKSGALLNRGRRLLIDVDIYLRWLAHGQEPQA